MTVIAPGRLLPACRGDLAAARRRLGASAVPRCQPGAKSAGQDDAEKTRPWGAAMTQALPPEAAGMVFRLPDRRGYV